MPRQIGNITSTGKVLDRTKLAKCTNVAWATTAIGLGVWEATAVTTRKVPTITRTCKMARDKNRRATEAAILLWLFGLGAHLLKREIEH